MSRPPRIMYALLLSFVPAAVAQNMGTGLYAFGSYDARGFDTVNIGNLNTHFEIPIVNKQGRGLPFNYTLAYDGLIWSPSGNGSGSWQPDSGWGFHGALLGGGFAGYLEVRELRVSCGPPIGRFPNFGYMSYFAYHDPYGRRHSFNYHLKSCESGDTQTGNGSTSDGSGYSYGINDGMVYTRSGQVINAPQSNSAMASSRITDSNGNSVSNNGNGTFTDTLGVTALTIGGSGTAASPLTLSYPVTLQSDSATSATATIYYKTYTVQTNFQCSGITEYPVTSVDLMDHITLPDA
ncbi:MAG: hypothetical protein M3R43_03595, partial [Acidobacteriota bacterium]|nr:hypothetical protein [Acidobacteriota bacterium]